VRLLALEIPRQTGIAVLVYVLLTPMPINERAADAGGDGPPAGALPAGRSGWNRGASMVSWPAIRYSGSLYILSAGFVQHWWPLPQGMCAVEGSVWPTAGTAAAYKFPGSEPWECWAGRHTMPAFATKSAAASNGRILNRAGNPGDHRSRSGIRSAMVLPSTLQRFEVLRKTSAIQSSLYTGSGVSQGTPAPSSMTGRGGRLAVCSGFVPIRRRRVRGRTAARRRLFHNGGRPLRTPCSVRAFRRAVRIRRRKPCRPSGRPRGRLW
jgi:hypothetical protein